MEQGRRRADIGKPHRGRGLKGIATKLKIPRIFQRAELATDHRKYAARLAACVRAIMVDRTMWTGSAADLLRLCAESARDDDISRGIGWARSPRALAGRLRRAQTFLRALGIEIVFSREGRAGTRIITMRTACENTVSTVSSVRANGAGQPEAGTG
jgi:hypothetical protein